MEPSEIDWNNVVSRYEFDEVYERISAPKWLDFTAGDTAINDAAWFCRSDCRHPVTYEDFDRWNPSPMSKILNRHLESIRADEQIQIQSDVDLKRRGKIASIFSSPGKPKLNSKNVREDMENINPNKESIPLMMKEKKMAASKKGTVKSSAEKNPVTVDEDPIDIQSSMPHPRLKSDFSARKLFAGRGVLSQMSEFWLELKNFTNGKVAISSLEEEEDELGAGLKENDEEKKALISTMKNGSFKKPEMTGSQEKRGILREVRASPPTPQKFPSPSSHNQFKGSKASTNSNLSSFSSPLCKASKFKSPLAWRREEKKELILKSVECNCSSEADPSTVDDVLWFLRPCTYFRRFN